MAGMSAEIFELNKKEDRSVPLPDFSDPKNKVGWLLLQAALVHIGMNRPPQEFVDRAVELFKWVDDSLLQGFDRE
jgi:hypothetical protein